MRSSGGIEPNGKLSGHNPSRNRKPTVEMSLEYHMGEFTTALDPSDPSWSMPPALSEYERILDVGCGMGQTLLAAKLPGEIEAFGVDLDPEAIDAGRLIAPPNIHLSVARGEKLPFPDESFDLVFSRVALPYMEINQALKEISRVLKNGGDFWFTLHPISKVLFRARLAIGNGNLKELLLCSYVLFNGVLFNWFGFQISVRRRNETFQTKGGIARAMKRAGLASIPMKASKHFVVQGQKPIPSSGA
jgi:ubiquinone/menaquinone biosynthesis C-methylase UbiE